MSTLSIELMELLELLQPQNLREAITVSYTESDCGMYNECGCGGSCGTSCSGGCDDSCYGGCYSRSS